ncbi:kxDL motif-containing protein CG10681 [Planococcus citri]|uniref:kxDL motif-containing protein CG10681 n=1 Tax=Planococcus citri TaxID=170843 RepID=UPI0031F94327
MATSENDCPELEDTDSIECFQNYTASEVFIQGLAGLIDQQDVESMIRAQKQILQRFEKTNEMLSNCNTLSVSRLKIANQQFKTYRQLLVDIKKDLDYTFRKISHMKTKLCNQYPESVAATSTKPDETNPDDCVEAADKPSTCVVEDEENSTCPPAANDSHPTVDTGTVVDTAACSNEQHISKKTEVSDSNSSESGEADSHVESISISTSDTA